MAKRNSIVGERYFEFWDSIPLKPNTLSMHMADGVSKPSERRSGTVGSRSYLKHLAAWLKAHARRRTTTYLL